MASVNVIALENTVFLYFKGCSPDGTCLSFQEANYLSDKNPLTAIDSLLAVLTARGRYKE